MQQGQFGQQQQRPEQLSRSASAALSSIMELRRETAHHWKTEELGSILKHQLGAPLRLALGQLSGEVAHELGKYDSRKHEPQNLAELLYDTQPPLELLVLTKRFAKRCNGDPDAPLPREIAMLLYYAAIVAAKLRHGQKLSALQNETLKKGLEWGKGQNWVDERMKALFAEGLQKLSAS